MRAFQLLAAMGLVALFAGNVDAADGQVPSATMAQLGLGNAEVVSDTEGEQIRGEWGVYGPAFRLATFNRLVPIIGAAQAAQVNAAFVRVNQIVIGLTGATPFPGNGQLWVLP